MKTLLAQSQITIPAQPSLGVAVNSTSQCKKVLKADEATKQSISRTDVWSLDVKLFVYFPEFDVRLAGDAEYYERESVKATIDAIKNSILNGETIDPISISFMEGSPVVTGGFKRYRAALQAATESGNLVKVAYNDVGNDANAILMKALKSNNVDTNNPVEKGLMFQSLLKGGKSEREISEQTGVPRNEIRACVATLGLPVEVKQLIVEGKISTYRWNSMVEEYGQTDALNIAVSTAETEAKVTPTSIKRAQGEKSKITKKDFVNSFKTVLREMLPKVQNCAITESGNAVVELTPEMVQMLTTLGAQIDS